MLDAQKMTELLNADDLLPIIWEGMREIWAVKNLPDDLRAFYDEREVQMCQWEMFFAEAMPELFDELLERATAQKGDYIRERLTGNTAVIIADSLSIREAMLLSHWLPELRFNGQESFAIAPFPTVTESLAQSLLGTPSPANGKDTDAFSYRYIAGPGSVGIQMPSQDRPLLIWVRLPDVELEHITQAQTTTVRNVLERTAETLRDILQRLEGRPVVVTSDHGYFYGTNPEHFEALPPGVQKLRRDRRAYKADEIKTLTAQDQKEFFVAKEGWYALRGRYWWAEKGQNARHTAHGGLSFAEVFVPILTTQV